MPFCDLLNFCVHVVNAVLNILLTNFTGIPPVDYPAAIGSVLGCNIV